MRQGLKKNSDLKVLITTKDSMCDECGENLWRKQIRY